METIYCRMCESPMTTRNRLCPTCGSVSKRKKGKHSSLSLPPVKLFLVLTWLFVVYAYLDFVHLV